jgi:hypothetical protein
VAAARTEVCAQCAAVCGRARGSVWQYTTDYIHKVAHNTFIIMHLYKDRWDRAPYSSHQNTNRSIIRIKANFKAN